MHVYVCVCVCVRACVRAYICMYVRICMYVYVCMFVRVTVAVPCRKRTFFHYNLLNSISSPNTMVSQLKPEVGSPLADILKLLRPKFKLSGIFHSRVTINHVK